MSTAEFKSTVVLALRQLLAPLGFRKVGTKFIRSENDVVHYLELQSSRYSTSQELQVTVNLGVYVPSLLDPPSKQVTSPVWSECHWRERLGHLSPENEDLWWPIDSIASSSTVASELTRRVREFALPALASLNSVRAIIELWRSGRSPGLTEFERSALLAKASEAASHAEG